MKENIVFSKIGAEIARQLRTLHQVKEESRYTTAILFPDDERQLHDVVPYGTSALQSWLRDGGTKFHTEKREKTVIVEDYERTKQNRDALNAFCYQHTPQSVMFFRQIYEAFEQETPLPEFIYKTVKDTVGVLEHLASNEIPEAYTLLEQYAIPDSDRADPLNQLSLEISYALDRLTELSSTNQ